MEPVLGIDLGTTNSAVSIVRSGKPEVLRDQRGRAILPSVVGVDSSGKLLVGEEARNQALVAPERTVRSIKRKMGQDIKVRMGDGEYAPQEISAMILRTLAEQAEREYGSQLTKAVITVPAFFNDNQREATREAGTLAGLDVLRIINEPTAASLVYEPHSSRNEKLLVYDLGGGTFDVSIVQVEAGVIEVLASHGDTHLGGDDFDQLLLDFVAEAFKKEHDIDLREIPVAKSRLLRAVEEAKIRLSSEAYTQVVQEFIAEKDGRSFNLNMTIDRDQYEELIEPLLQKTLNSVDAALEDAKLTAEQIDRVVLVGGSSRTPLVHRMLQAQLHRELHHEIDPDLCVSLGAAVQGALVAGIDVGPVLVDITPHTLGIQCLGELFGVTSHEVFSPIIRRNSPLPATRSEIYYTAQPGQRIVEIHVLQGESEISRFNESVGRFKLEGLNAEADEGNEILVRFELNLDGILKVSAEERETGLAKEITIDNAITRFRAASRTEAKQRLAAMFGPSAPSEDDSVLALAAEKSASPFERARQTLSTARRLVSQAPAADADEMRELIDKINRAIEGGDAVAANAVAEQLDDLLFYLQDA
jgi:molecular chaperone DnaK